MTHTDENHRKEPAMHHLLIALLLTSHGHHHHQHGHRLHPQPATVQIDTAVVTGPRTTTGTTPDGRVIVFTSHREVLVP